MPIQGGIALSDSNRKVTFTPASALAPNTTYTVTVQPTIADMADRLIDNPGNFTFQTGAGADLTRASVTTASPLSGAQGVPVNAVVEAQFSKRIDPLTVTGATFTVTPSGGFSIPGTITTTGDGLSATFTPSAPLQAGTIYNVNVSGGITDLTGQALLGIGSSFTTAP